MICRTSTGDDGGTVALAAGGGGGGGGSVLLPNFGTTRRVVLGRRGSGVVLGDDLLRVSGAIHVTIMLA